MLQGFSIVVSKILNVQHRKIPRLEYIHDLTKRRDAGSWENALSDPRTEWAQLVASDEMQQSASGISDGAMDDAPQVFIMFRSNVLQHPNRDKGVIVSGNVPVVVLDKFHLVTKVFSPRALPREKNLLFGNIE